MVVGGNRMFRTSLGVFFERQNARFALVRPRGGVCGPGPRWQVHSLEKWNAMSGMLLVSIDIAILSDGTRNVIAIGLADESEGKTRLAAPLRFAAIGANRGLFGVRIGRLNTLESWLPLCRW